MARLIKSIPRQKLFTGILVDVSNSMKGNMPGGGSETPWASSAFQVVDSLIEHDVTAGNHVFVIGFGAARGGTGTPPENAEPRPPEVPPVFDVVGTIDLYKERLKKKIKSEFEDVLEPYRKIPHAQRVREIISILEKNGAPYIRQWVKDLEVVENNLTSENSATILYMLETEDKKNKNMRVLIDECLPVQCREGVVTRSSPMGRASSFFSFLATPVVALVKQATDKHVLDVIEKARRLLTLPIPFPKNPGIPEIVGVTENSIFDVDKAYHILRGDSRDQTRCVEPCIYGSTPLLSALEDAKKLFSNPKFQNHKKLLFVLSDGMPTDDDKGCEEVQSRPTVTPGDFRIDQFLKVLKLAMKNEATKESNRSMSIQRIRSTGVTIVSCYVTKDKAIEPLRLYNTKQESWEVGAKFMFDLASTFETQSLPHTIFTRRKSGRKSWTIDFETNETRLFAQVNHRDNIRDVCDFACDIVCSGDALSDMLASVDLDLHIHEYITKFPAQERQKGGTCYAHASAVVIHLATNRIHGRVGGYPNFTALRNDMVKEYGVKGGNTFEILNKVCQKYRLQCQEVDFEGALQAVTEKRPVVASFSRTDAEIRQFVNFFENKATRAGILTRDYIAKRPEGAKTIGHAMVLTSFTSRYLCFMDSWGFDWGDNGFIKIGHNVFEMRFFDVFFEEYKLLPQEKTNYKTHGNKQAADLWEALKGLQRSKYKCPLCHVESPVTDFTGNLGRVRCPRCRKEFNGSRSGNILALNMYLTSISEYHHEPFEPGEKPKYQMSVQVVA